LRDLLGLALANRVEPLGGRRRPRSLSCADGAEHGRDARPDVADDRRIDTDVAVRLLRRDVDLDELLAAPFLGAVAAPRLAFAVRKQPVQARTDHQDDVGFWQ